MNPRISITVASAVLAVSAFAACGGGGGGGGSTPPVVTPVPTSAPTATPTPIPTAAAIGFVAASGPVTELNGVGGGFGSTITNASNVAVFVAQSATTPDSVSGSSGTLATTQLAVSESGGQATQTRARAAVVGQRFERDADFRRRPDVLRFEGMRSIARSIRHTATVDRYAQSIRGSDSAAAPANFVPGSTFTFQLQAGNISGTNSNPTPIPVPAHLIVQTAHANVWLDDADANATEYPSGVQADMAVVGQRFEENYAVETTAFGPAYTTKTVQFQECDATSKVLTGSPDPGTDTTGKTDPQMNIIITNALAGTGEGGYFYGADMLSQSEANCIPGTPKIVVNNLKLIVMTSDTNTASPGFAVNNEPFWLQETVPQTLAHEYQHYLHYTNKFLQQIVNDPNNQNAGTIDSSFIDEGCSVLAQDLVVDGAGRNQLEKEAALFVRSYLLEPDLYSLTSFSGYQPDPASSSASAPYGFYHNNAGNYGYSYLFMRYLYDRFGAGALKAIYAEQSGGVSGLDVGPVTAASSESFPQLYQEFATALAIHIGGSTPDIISDPKFTFSSKLVLRGLTQTYSRRIATNIRNIVQPGPENPEIFNGTQPQTDSSGNVVRQTLTPGQTITLKLISGATLYLTPSGTPANGATLRASGTAQNLQGALGQGPLPTPTPAYF